MATTPIIESITLEEYEQTRKRRLTRTSLSEEGRAMLELQPMTGIKFPCRWTHPHPGNCYSRATFCSLARRHGLKIHTCCRNGSVYVFRVE